MLAAWVSIETDALWGNGGIAPRILSHLKEHGIFMGFKEKHKEQILSDVWPLNYLICFIPVL
jgi:hypothetical protein